jgi:hypothetical protein
MVLEFQTWRGILAGNYHYQVPMTHLLGIPKGEHSGTLHCSESLREDHRQVIQQRTGAYSSLTMFGWPSNNPLILKWIRTYQFKFSSLPTSPDAVQMLGSDALMREAVQNLVHRRISSLWTHCYQKRYHRPWLMQTLFV